MSTVYGTIDDYVVSTTIDGNARTLGPLGLGVVVFGGGSGGALGVYGLGGAWRFLRRPIT